MLFKAACRGEDIPRDENVICSFLSKRLILYQPGLIGIYPLQVQ